MKKFFRVALVCALAGATLLYTGCTKDYSEDLNSLQKTVEEQGKKIFDQGETIKQLQGAISALEAADESTLGLINGLKNRCDSLDSLVDVLTKEKNRLDTLIQKNAGDILDLQRRVNQIDTLIQNLQAKDSLLEKEIDSLKARATAIETSIREIKDTLAKKADKQYVDDELAKKADTEWVKENYATTKALIDTAAAIRGALMAVNKEISGIKGEIADLTDNLGQLGQRVNKVADSVQMNFQAINEINETIAGMQGDIDTLQADMTTAKKDIKTAQHVADSAAKLAGDAWDYAEEVENYLIDNYYPKSVIDQKLAQKLDLTVWTADTARINAKFRDIDQKILDVIDAYQKADSLLDAKIDSLDAALTDLIGTKVDTTTFNEFVKAVWAKFEQVDLEISKLINRVQSIVYLPEYDDNRITLNWAQMVAQNSFDTRKVTLPASFNEEAWKDFFEELYGQVPAELESELAQIGDNLPFIPVIGPNEPFYPGIGVPVDIIDGPVGDYSFYAATPIVEPSHVKYRIYGIDAASIVERLVECVNEGQDLLSFDVIRVLTRVNKDNVKLNITHAEVDDLFTDGSVIDLTVVPEGLPDDFWLYTWDVKNFMNPRTHYLYFFIQMFLNDEMSPALFQWLYQQFIDNAGSMDIRPMLRADGVTEETTAEVEEDTEFPAFSVSLVLNDVSDTTSRMITSAYNNVVPAAKSDIIEMKIKLNGEDVTYKQFADTVEIPYNDLEKYTVLENTELILNFKGKDYTAKKFEELGMNLGEPQARFFAETDFSESIAARLGHDMEDSYFENTSDDDEPVAYVNLSEINPEGVFSKEYVELRYYLGPGFCYTTALVKVIPVTINVEADLVESETVTPITWNYTKDAPVDASIFQGNTNLLYNRDSAIAKYDEEKLATDFAKAGIEMADFAGKVPVDSISYFVFIYKDAAGEVTKDTITVRELLAMQEAADENTPVFNVYPYFTEDGELLAKVQNFVFNDLSDDEKGALTEVDYKAVYSLPDDVMTAVQVIVTGKILFEDRDRTPIVITLPTTKEDYFLNFATTAKDSLYNEAGVLVPTVETSFEAHHLTPADVQDAFGRVTSKHWDNLNDPPFEGGVADRNVLYGSNFIWDSENPQGDPSEGGYYYVENERIDSITNTTRPIDAPAGTEFETATTLVRNNTTAHINTEYNAADVARVIFSTYCNYNSRDLRNLEIIPNTDMTSYLTLWYGQDVIVKKRFEINTDGIFDYERINSYVGYKSDDDVYTTVQPLWQPDGATAAPYNVPVTSYQAHDVLLNQHFRIVEVATGTVCTDLEGVIKDEYSFLRRRFWLDSLDKMVVRIEDPRKEGPDKYDDWDLANPTWAVDWAVTINNALTADTPFNQEPNILSYYSKADQTPVYAYLYIMNDNGAFVKLTTRFDRKSTYAPLETYENYVIKKYDPLAAIGIKPDVPTKINVNNSIKTVTSIYEFLTLKDKRGWELIDGSTNGWVVGDDTNGFATGVTADGVYSLHFTHEIEYPEDLEPETRNRFSFDETTGILTYDNRIETQLEVPIPVKLSINVEYPWGTRNAEITLEFYNKPVGE